MILYILQSCSMFSVAAVRSMRQACLGMKSLQSLSNNSAMRFVTEGASTKWCQALSRHVSGRSRRGGVQAHTSNRDESFEFVEFAAEEGEWNHERHLQEECERRLREEQDKELSRAGAVVQRTLQQQVASLKPFLKDQSKEMDFKDELGSDIEFKDFGYNTVVHDPKKKPKHKASKGEHKIYGNPDPDLAMSDKQCMGCGALMHSLDPSIPGYLPSEKYVHMLEQSEDLAGDVICQRCFLLVHHQKALNVTVSQEQYRSIVSNIKTKEGLVIFMVDMLDIPNSIFLDILDFVGDNKAVLVLGNKIDLLPGDSSGYLNRIKDRLKEYCIRAGINKNGKLRDVRLISAKTGYGIEELITALQGSWKYKGDVYLVGATNAGKSTLFNTLLQSDYSKAKASEIIKRATISPWPGTTLNLLKFPIVNPTPYRMFKRQERLEKDSAKTEIDLGEEEQKHLKSLKKQSYVVGRVGRTFKIKKIRSEDVMFDADSLSMRIEENDQPLSDDARETLQFTNNELKDAHWFYDTPGIVKENCVLNHLNDKEVKIVLATHAIIPRTFVLQPGMTLFLGSLGRIDFLQGEKSAWFTVVASNLLPVHITSSSKADDLYQKHSGKALLGVPIGGEERMKSFPLLVYEDVNLVGIGHEEAVADIQLSTAGWIAITAHTGHQLGLRCYTPKGTKIAIRTPPLLPLLVNIKGERIRKTPAYATKKPACVVKNINPFTTK